MSIIGITGAHRVGKTSLAQAVCDRLNKNGIKAYFISSQVHSILGDLSQHSCDFATRLEHQTRLLDHYNKLCREAMESDCITIFDRTPLCFLAYTLSDVPRVLSPDLDEQFHKYYDACLEDLTFFFNAVFLVRPDIPIVPCATSAAPSWSYQRVVNHIIAGLLFDFVKSKPAIYVLNSIDFDERVAAVASQIPVL